jgi:hypothetical protein
LGQSPVPHFSQILKLFLFPVSSDPKHLSSHVRVELFPHKGAGQAKLQVLEVRKNGFKQDVHLVEPLKHVSQLAEQALQILLSFISPY